MKPIPVALIAIAVTLLAVFLTFNFMPGEKKIERQLQRLYSAEDPQFRRSMGVLLGPPIIEGNQVDVLRNGDQIFPSMLKAIREAKQSITFETYIYWSGTIGEEFSAALKERARAGVKVHVLLDFIGSIKLEDAQMEAMKAAGVKFQRYHKPVWWKLTKLNNRTHRKVLVVDGEIGFTGGVGIADHWRGNGQDKDHWRDTHFRVEGPVVGQMQAVFADNWTKSTGIVLDGATYFPALAAKAPMPRKCSAARPAAAAKACC